MIGKIEISLEQLERWQKTALQWGIDSIGVEIMHALAAPVVERQEPVAWLTKCKLSELVEQAEPNEKASNPEHWTDAFAVYTSPPAPVADEMVRLLTRARIYARGEFRDEIDACLDKLKRMNK